MPADALEISTNLLHTANNFFKYLKTLKNERIAKEVENIRRIHKYTVKDNDGYYSIKLKSICFICLFLVV